MANQQTTNIQLSVKDIYAKICPKCKRIIKDMVRDKVTEQMVDNILGAEVT